MAVVVLAIGLAFVASFLSLYVDLLLRPHPGFERGNPIVTFGWNDGRNAGGLPLPVVERIVEEAVTLEAAAGIQLQQLQAGPERERVVAELVTREFFDGVRPKMYMGRGFTREEHDADGEPVVVIAYRYWREQLDGRPDVLGLTLEIEGQASAAALPPVGSEPQGEAAELPKDFRIIGVMSPDFIGTVPPQYNEEVSVWLTIERGLPLTMPPGAPADMVAMLLSLNAVRGIGRRASGASSIAVARELNGRFADEEFMNRPGARYDVLDGLVFNANVHRNTQRQLQLFLGASMLLALVAAANVSLFLLARAPGRRRELGIRMAVGAPLKRLARQLASEATVLVAAGAVFGILLSTWLADYLRGLPFWRQAQWRDVTLLDWRVLALVGAFLLFVTLLVSLAPIVGLKRLGIAASSRQIAARPTAAQRVAGTAQVAIAAVLGGAAIAFAWYLGSVLLGDPGYRLEQLYAAPYSARSMITGPIQIENGQIVGAVDHSRRREALQALPGVTAVTLGSGAPGVLNGTATLSVPDPQNPEEPMSARLLTIDVDYVDVLGLRLLHGRNITASDSNAVLVNQSFARRLFGRDDVVGEPFPLNLQNQAQPQIVGVLADLSYEHPLADIEPTAFTPVGVLARVVFGSSTAIIESALPPAALQQQLIEIGPTLEMNFASNITALADARSEVLAPDRARGFLTIGTALLVVLLAGFGFYGTQRYLVTAGRREYAIRASLGAGPRALGRLVFVRGLVLGLPGLVIGAPLTFILVAWLRDDYISRDVAPGAVTVAVLVGLAALLLVASVGPARLARGTQPAPLLRED